MKSPCGRKLLLNKPLYIILQTKKRIHSVRNWKLLNLSFEKSCMCQGYVFAPLFSKSLFLRQPQEGCSILKELSAGLTTNAKRNLVLAQDVLSVIS